jgi:LCP family protein required for cell wall assembly
MRKKHSQPVPAARDRFENPDNLLDLNRALNGYTYHPDTKGIDDPMRTAPHGHTPAPHEKPPHKRWKKIVKRTLVTLLILVLLASGWVGFKLLKNEIKLFGWGGVTSLLHKTRLKGEDSGHVNILLAGNSADDPGHSGGNLTDSIMVVSLNTKTNTAFMLSIPRDLYVDIPGDDFGYAKINEAYQDGEQSHFHESGYADGGMGLLEKTVSEHLGMPINYYALVNYSAVRQAVNAVGGITVTIQSSDPRGLYDPSPDLNNNYKPLVKLPNGVNQLNGVQALGLSRARGDHYGAYGYGLSDFTRTSNQRLILLGLKDKVTSLGTLSNPVKLGELFDSVGDNVKTDMTLAEVRRAYDLSKALPDKNIASVGLNDVNGQSLLASYTNRLGQSTLIPKAGIDDFSAIQDYVNTLLNPPAPAAGSSSKQ